MQITSVTSLKTNHFKNDLGQYEYKTLKAELMFGFEFKPIADGRTLQISRPEKALLDLLYLFPFYDSEQEMENLRLDEDFMEEQIDTEILDDFTRRFKNRALTNRIRLLKKTYHL